MADRKALGKKLTERFQDLQNRIYDAQNRLAGRTSISRGRMRSIECECNDFRHEKLSLVQSSLAREFLRLAPDMRGMFEENVRKIEDSIWGYGRSTERVSAQTERNLRNAPVRIIPGANRTEVITRETVPVIRHYPLGGLLGILGATTPVVVGSETILVSKTYDNNRTRISTNYRNA